MQSDAANNEAFAGLPGAELVAAGLKDLKMGELTENALLVLVASPRLRRLGIDVPEGNDVPRPYEHQLYSSLEQTYGDGAYSQYNSLIRRIVSFARAAEHRM